ncbi:MAG: hypothetical protein ABIJ92_04995 [Candidatus Aenigmatarchaeota archaeon]
MSQWERHVYRSEKDFLRTLFASPPDEEVMGIYDNYMPLVIVPCHYYIGQYAIEKQSPIWTICNIPEVEEVKDEWGRKRIAFPGGFALKPTFVMKKSATTNTDDEALNMKNETLRCVAGEFDYVCKLTNVLHFSPGGTLTTRIYYGDEILEGPDRTATYEIEGDTIFIGIFGVSRVLEEKKYKLE